MPLWFGLWSSRILRDLGCTPKYTNLLCFICKSTPKFGTFHQNHGDRTAALNHSSHQFQLCQISIRTLKPETHGTALDRKRDHGLIAVRRTQKRRVLSKPRIKMLRESENPPKIGADFEIPYSDLKTLPAKNNMFFWKILIPVIEEFTA